MRRLPALAAIALGMAAPAEAAGVEGHYYLEGVMETGSELLLRPDGRFQFYLAYGALDVFAEGKWREDKSHVLLESDRPKPGYEAVQAFDALHLTVTKSGDGELALETQSNGRRMLYVRHGDAKQGD